ncbi:MAG: zinc metallopeptidase [Granulosicoccus sp.]|nr:zinc metallopeptidase [Granulosicoccus sp.]
MIIVIGIVFFALAAAVRWWMMKTYRQWGQVPNKLGANGQAVARHILDSNGLHHVQLEVSKGQLTDHYMPSKKLIRLSENINNDASVASVAVAAHEVGHAIQDAQGYGPMKFKAVLMPVAAAGHQLGLLLVLGAGFFGGGLVLDVGMLLLGSSILAQLITLPIEFDASKRALAELERLNLVDQADYAGAKKMLTAAAMTYVASAAGSFALAAVFLSNIFRRR